MDNNQNEVYTDLESNSYIPPSIIDIVAMTNNTPNDTVLGEKIRNYVNNLLKVGKNEQIN